MVPIPRPRTRSHAPLLLLALSAVLSASGCLSDVSVPPCVVDDSCGDGGAGGDNDSTAPLAGTSRGGTTQPHGGSGGTMPVMPNGGAAGGGDPETTGGMAGAGGETDCDCLVREIDLRPPCEGATYQTSLNVQGGEPPYRWQISPYTPGWSIVVDPSHDRRVTLRSSKVDAGDTTLTVKVTDASGGSATRTYTLTARTACWFGFTALGEQGGELRLLDPFAEAGTPAPLAHNEGVYDFQFSPDGHHLAYRFGSAPASPQGKHLALVDLDTLEEQVLSFGEDRVNAYAWSPNSHTLAVGFIAGENGYLSAVRLPDSASTQALTVQTPIPAFVESELYWVGNELVAYHAALVPDFAHPGQFLSENPFHLRTAFYAELQANGFAAHAGTFDSFPPDVVMKPTSEGFFMITGGDPYTIFTPLSGDRQAVSHLFISLVSPSGKYSALLDGSPLLQILSAEEGYFGAPVATAKTGDECPMPLAWARGAERIACVADVANADGQTTHGEVRVFDLQDSSGELEMSTVSGFCRDDVWQLNAASCTTLGQGYGYGTAQAAGAARAFSPSGRWFAFASVFEGKSHLYWADLGSRPFSLKGSRYFRDAESSRASTHLTFSPDERFLLYQRGSELTRLDLNDSTLEDGLSGARKIENCSDDFPARPNNYCGSDGDPATMLWSPDSKAFAFRQPGALTVVESRSSSAARKVLLATECIDQCSNQFLFQPHPL
jgi:WD40 repeat protein